MSANTTAPILPLQTDSGAIDGFTDEQVTDLIKQNVKMIIMTIPGERIMQPDFGVGIERYIFEMQNSNAPELLRENIRSQLLTYMPTIRLLEISTRTDINYPSNLYVLIRYEIDFLNTRDQLELLLEY